MARPEDSGKSVLILVADKVEDLEFYYPYYRCIEEGHKVDVVSPDGGEVKCKNSYKIMNTAKISAVGASVAAGYDLLYVPGGKAPEDLKKNDEALVLVRSFVDTGKPVAAFCHGPLVLAAAGVIRGVTVSGWPEIEEEVIQSGANFVQEEVKVDGQFISGRWPADLPAFTRRVLEAVKGGVNTPLGAGRGAEYRA
jgi:protease I